MKEDGVDNELKVLAIGVKIDFLIRTDRSIKSSMRCADGMDWKSTIYILIRTCYCVSMHFFLSQRWFIKLSLFNSTSFYTLYTYVSIEHKLG